jgi:SRSO17 transposase
MVGARLFLPESWTENAMRMEKAGVPGSERAFATKPELALRMLKELKTQGVSWDFTGADGLYGNSTAYRRGIDREGLGEYVLDVHSDQRVYLYDPKPFVPGRTSDVGREPSRLKTHHRAWRADELVSEQADSAWKTEEYRVGTKGVMRRQVLVMTVWTWDGIEESAVKERLIASRRSGTGKDKTDIKYALSNDREMKRSPHRLLVRQMHRHWIERSIEDAKQELGLAEHQTRSWQAWEHHTALTMMALVFLMQERILNKGAMPLLSCRDVRNMIAHKLTAKTDDTPSLLAVIDERHRRRASDKARWKRKTDSG